VPIDYYDTPKKIRESLGQEYANYDTPPCAKSINRAGACGCPQPFTQQPRSDKNCFGAIPENFCQQQKQQQQQQEQQRYTKFEMEDGRQYLRKDAHQSHGVRPHPGDADCTGMQYVWAQNQVERKGGCGLLGLDQQTNCPCQRVMGWTELLPCRRGSGAEDSGIPIHKVSQQR
jgi:hypothetical protein